ncbi:MAG: DUF4157 domain-containing protein [Armatimonadetes bacterium]|nr:DUF4157 domain-containing protein [Armatimonadota bacterium]MDE2205496.1 DUF4157 domain-containing protein [Armatimonadota bacterium]
MKYLHALAAASAMCAIAVCPISASALAPRPKPVVVTTDTSQVPNDAAWAAMAQKLVEKWYPKVAKLLATPGFTPPGEVHLLFVKDMKGVAYTAGTTIHIAAHWIEQHPEDKGMVIHEMTHVVQQYPTYDPSWLVEGIADWVRFFVYEPKAKLPPINPQRAHYTDAYKTAAAFLAWIQKAHHVNIALKMNAALRSNTYTPDLWKDDTGMSLDDLWQEFIQKGNLATGGR